MTTRRAPPGRRGYTRSRRGQRPAVGWTNATLASTALAAGTQAQTDLLGAFTVGEKFNIGKILRVFGEVHFRGQSANVNLAGRFGLAIITDDSLAAGVVPDALGDEAFGWYWNAPMLWDRPDLEFQKSIVDARTQRKLIGDASTLILMIENNSIAMDYMFGLRILYQKK